MQKEVMLHPSFLAGEQHRDVKIVQIPRAHEIEAVSHVRILRLVTSLQERWHPVEVLVVIEQLETFLAALRRCVLWKYQPVDLAGPHVAKFIHRLDNCRVSVRQPEGNSAFLALRLGATQYSNRRRVPRLQTRQSACRPSLPRQAAAAF